MATRKPPRLFLLDAHMETAPASFNVFARRTREDLREYDYVASGCSSGTSNVSCAATTRHMVAQALPHYVSRRDYSWSGLHRLYCAYAARLGASARRAARRWLLVVDHFAYVARPGASARRAARHAAHRAARCWLLGLAQARRRLLRLRRASGCLGTSRGSSRGLSHCSSSTTPPHAGSSSTTPPRAARRRLLLPPPRVRVPRHVVRLVTRLVAPLVVDYSASRRLVVDYFAYAARLCASARRAAHLSSSITPPRAGSSSTTSPPPRVRPLVVDYSASRRLVVDYFASVAHPGASAHRAARHAACRAARRRLLRLRRATGCLGTSRGSSRGSLHRSSSMISPTPRVRGPRHVARPVTQLIIDYSVRRDFVLRPRWLYFSHAVRRDYLCRGNIGSTSSTPRAAMTSSSGRIASTIHLD
jgi:hypothetical protein